MKTLENVSLRKYTTMKIGGIARKLYFPESREELIEVLETIKSKNLYILGNGSNLLINDQKVFDEVISLKMMDSSIKNIGQGHYYIGSSVILQKLIRHINSDGYGGIEYLFSVPASMGGAVAMNAGRGKKHNESISDYIQEVYVYDYSEKKIKTFSKDECEFCYRGSFFKGKEMIILGALLKFSDIAIEEAKRKREDRMVYVKKYQDNSGHNCGSIFREYNKYIMHIFRVIHLGYKGGMTYSNKTINWLINTGNGTYKQSIDLIEKAIKIHKFLKLKIVIEVIIWD